MEKTNIRYINSLGEVISSFLCTNCPGGSVPIIYENKIVCDECNRVIAVKYVSDINPQDTDKPKDTHNPQDTHKPQDTNNPPATE